MLYGIDQIFDEYLINIKRSLLSFSRSNSFQTELSNLNWHLSTKLINSVTTCIKMVRPLLFLTSLLPIVAASWNINSEKHRHACQKHTEDPLEGCDLQRTKYVDTVGNSSTFKTVQSGMCLIQKWDAIEVQKLRG